MAIDASSVVNEQNGEVMSNQIKSVESLALQPIQHRRSVAIIVAFMLIISTILIAIGSSLGNHSESGNLEKIHDDNMIATITSGPSSSPSNSPTIQQDLIMNDFLVEALGIDDDEEAGILVAGSAQWKAKRWLVQDDPIALDPSNDKVPGWRILQRYAIATLQFSLIDDSEFGLDWMNMDECESVHINCDDDGYVRTLEIGK